MKIPPASASAGRMTTGTQKTNCPCCEVRKTGDCFVSFGRMEIWSSSSASHETLLRTKSRLPWKVKNWFVARVAEP